MNRVGTDATTPGSVILSLGSNKGDRERQITAALEKIEERIGNIRSLSALYTTVPVGFDSPNNFINCVCEVYSVLDIYSIFAITREIEKELGRIHKSVGSRYSDRLIDIDLIMAGNLVIESVELTIPHPLFHRRDFVLTPLCEIAPDLVHPLLGKSIHQLKADLDAKETIQ